MTKEEMELEKLAIELKILKRPWYLKPPVLVSVLSLSFAIYQYQVARIKVNTAEEKTVIAEQKEIKADAVIMENELKADYLSVKESKVLAEQKRLMSPESPITSEPGYVMDVWAYGVPESVVQLIRSHLQTEGNTVGFGGLLSHRPGWLALESTVFFYDKGSKTIAQTIADDLQKLTNLTFKVARGAGLGVDKEEKDKTFFVHVVK